MPPTTQRYVPAAGHAALTGIYDAAMALTMREHAWRPQLTEAVIDGLPSGGLVIDVGCGTGTQTIAIGQARPDARVIGVDGDPNVLAIAATKPGAEHLELCEGLADDLPLADGEADRVIISLLLHHLQPDGKITALREARRVLAPDGQLHVIDWDTPAGPLTRLGFAAVQLLDGRSNTRDHVSGRWREAFHAAGLRPPHTLRRLPTAWGTLAHITTGHPATTNQRP